MSAWENIQKDALKARIAMDLEGPAVRLCASYWKAVNALQSTGETEESATEIVNDILCRIQRRAERVMRGKHGNG